MYLHLILVVNIEMLFYSIFGMYSYFQILTSCGGTSNETVRKSTFVYPSIHGSTKNIPKRDNMFKFETHDRIAHVIAIGFKVILFFSFLIKCYFIIIFPHNCIQICFQNMYYFSYCLSSNSLSLIRLIDSE